MSAATASARDGSSGARSISLRSVCPSTNSEAMNS